MSIHHSFPEELKFYPEHPSDEKTAKIQSSLSPMLEGQEAPFEVKELHNQFEKNLYGSLAIYEDKRFDVTGVAIMVGRDVLDQVKVGDRVTIRSNYLVLSNKSGIVMKYSELLCKGK